MITYPITRFLVELLRNDEGAFFAGLTISQNISAALFVAGLAYWGWLLRQPRALHRDQEADPLPQKATLATARA
jgi:phosphatidylglycerol:prolipoprotein diacylglycerol transferase